MRTVSILFLAAAVSSAGAQAKKAQEQIPRSARDDTTRSRELLPEEQIQQVLNRLAFGPRAGDVAAVRAMGVDQWIEQQLHPEKINDTAAERIAS
ncbi:MAG TPA: DUF1800 family protein, partial [Gemmatimonadaceae bacterium]